MNSKENNVFLVEKNNKPDKVLSLDKYQQIYKKKWFLLFILPQKPKFFYENGQTEDDNDPITIGGEILELDEVIKRGIDNYFDKIRHGEDYFGTERRIRKDISDLDIKLNIIQSLGTMEENNVADEITKSIRDFIGNILKDSSEVDEGSGIIRSPSNMTMYICGVDPKLGWEVVLGEVGVLTLPGVKENKEISLERAIKGFFDLTMEKLKELI